MDELQASGLFGVLQPAYFGGAEADPCTFFDVVMALSSADASVGWVYAVLSVHSWMTALLSEEALDDVWGDDPNALVCSAAFCRQGGIDKVDEGYRLSAQFGFASGCYHSAWALIISGVRNAPEEGVLGFLVPSQDYQIVDNWNVSGLCGTGSCDLAVEAIVPEHRVLNVMGTPACSVSDATLYRLPFMSLFPHAVTVPLLGAAQGAVDDYVADQQDRVSVLGTRVAAATATQVRVAESTWDIDAALLCVYRNFAELMQVAEIEGAYPTELLARVDRDQYLAVRRAISGSIASSAPRAGGPSISMAGCSGRGGTSTPVPPTQFTRPKAGSRPTAPSHWACRPPIFPGRGPRQPNRAHREYRDVPDVIPDRHHVYALGHGTATLLYDPRRIRP